ncbi:hypothetical protein ACH4U6_01560 [Streptomyces netropsis]|uniref:hypothetical protein n=1 Tax=Streptomyces netropsis TaxID=55404 RepID=UPI0037B36145
MVRLGRRVVGEGFLALRRSLTLWWLSIVATALSPTVSVMVLLFGTGLGLLMMPRTVAAVRRLAGRWSGEPIPDPYEPPPTYPGCGWGGAPRGRRGRGGARAGERGVGRVCYPT